MPSLAGKEAWLPPRDVTIGEEERPAGSRQVNRRERCVIFEERTWNSGNENLGQRARPVMGVRRFLSQKAFQSLFDDRFLGRELAGFDFPPNAKL
jgi:hypothetical protein